MKKSVVILLCLCLVFSMTACGGQSKEESKPVNTSQEQSIPIESEQEFASNNIEDDKYPKHLTARYNGVVEDIYIYLHDVELENGVDVRYKDVLHQDVYDYMVNYDMVLPELADFDKEDNNFDISNSIFDYFASYYTSDIDYYGGISSTDYYVDGTTEWYDSESSSYTHGKWFLKDANTIAELKVVDGEQKILLRHRFTYGDDAFDIVVYDGQKYIIPALVYTYNYEEYPLTEEILSGVWISYDSFEEFREDGTHVYSYSKDYISSYSIEDETLYITHENSKVGMERHVIGNGYLAFVVGSSYDEGDILDTLDFYDILWMMY